MCSILRWPSGRSHSVMEPYRVRPAVREDCPAILAIYNEAVLTTTASYDYEPRTLEHRVQWFEAHERDGYPMFVAEDFQGLVVGWSALNKYHDRIGYRFTTENSIYIAEAHRGRGLGKKLLEPLIDAARAKGLRAIIACIDAANDVSVRLHARYGFETVGHFKQVGFKFGRWLDVVYMEKLLSEP